jgi:hypothetical protein
MAFRANPTGTRRWCGGTLSEAIIEEIIDPLVTGELADTFPNIELQRTAPITIEIDFRVPEGAHTITVEPRSRSESA